MWLKNRMRITDEGIRKSCLRQVSPYNSHTLPSSKHIQFMTFMLERRRTVLPQIKLVYETIFSGTQLTTTADKYKALFTNEQWVSDLKAFINIWGNQVKLANSAGTDSSILRPACPDDHLQNMLTSSTSEELKNAFRGAYRVLRATGIQWQLFTTAQLTQTFLLATVQAGHYNRLRRTMWEMPTMWVIRQELESMLSTFAKQGQLSSPSFEWWDGIVEPPTLLENNPLLNVLPIHNNAETMGTYVQRALVAQQLKSNNKDTLTTIYNLALKEGLGTIEVNGRQYVDPKLHEATIDYVNVSACPFSDPTS